MKNFLILFVIFSASLNAQTFTAKGFKLAETDKATDELINVWGNNYEVYKTASGSKFIKAISRTGTVYAVWIGEETEFQHEGETVRISKNGNYFILVISDKTGYPYCKYLDKNA